MPKIQDILQSVTLKEYIAYANQAVADYNWDDAYDYWNYIRLNFPEHGEAVYQTARTLYKLHEFEEAKRLATDYLDDFSDHYQSEILLGDIALAQNKGQLAYRLWDSVRTKYPDHAVGYIKLAKLAEKRNPTEAIQLWMDIREQFPNVQGTVFKSLTELYIQHNYWHLALETAKGYVTHYPSDPNSYLLALAVNLRYIQQHEKLQFEGNIYHLFAQCTHALKMFPNNLSLRIFEAKLALYFHKYTTARDKFEILADEHPDSIAIHTHYAKTLVILGEESQALDILLTQLSNPLAIESGEYVHQLLPLLHLEGQNIWENHLDKILNLLVYPDAVLLLVTHLEIFSLYPDALRLLELAQNYSAIQFQLLYLKAKDRIHNAIRVESTRPYGDIYIEPNIPYPSAYNHLQDDMRAVVDTHLQLIDTIKSNNQNTYLNTHTSAYEIFEVATSIIKAIQSKSPFSVVRSDGHLLPYTDDDKHDYELDQIQSEAEKWNGNQFFDFDRHKHSLLNADIIGIPEPYTELYLDESDLAVHRRFRAILAWMTEQHFDDAMITSSEVNHDLQIWGLYDYIFSHVDSVSIVSYTPVGDKLMHRFGIGVRIEYWIPSDSQTQTPLDAQPNVIHYPEIFKTTLNQINVSYVGEVFLVNAGVLSPMYCDAIKRQGGIALDIGETLDLWVSDPIPNDIVNHEVVPFYRVHRTSIWWRYLNAVVNIPFGRLINNHDKTYWINLAHRIDRRISTANNLNRLNIPHQRIEAITPHNLPEFRMRRDQLKLLDVEKACLTSHLVALHTGIVNGDELFFVQEDDFQELVSSDYNEIIADAPKNWDILQLHTHGIEALQNNYLAYLSGHLWLSWNWKNPSTALYLTHIKAAQKILDKVSYVQHQSVDLKSASPSLPVADRVLYKDFETYAITYPIGITDGSGSDILNVNSFRHANAVMQAKRFHIMTHKKNPQLQFNQVNNMLEEEHGKQIIIGLGASTLGFPTLQRLLNLQDNSFISNQMGSHPYRFPSWDNDEDKVFAIINYIFATRDCDYVGDMMSAYLSYVETLISLYPTAKFICLHSTREDEVESLLNIDPHTNIFQEHSGIGYQHNHVYDRSVDKFDLELTKVEAVRNYVEVYSEESLRLANKYPTNVWRLNISDLDNPDDMGNLLTWLGYEEPKFVNVLNHEVASINMLDIPNYDKHVQSIEESSLYQFMDGEQSSDDPYTDLNLYEIRIYKGKSKEKESLIFVDGNLPPNNIVFQIDFLRVENLMILNHCVNSKWGQETRIRYTYKQNTIIFAYYDMLLHCMYLLDTNLQHFVTFELHPSHQITDVKVNGRMFRLLSSRQELRVDNLWRFSDQKSGFNALPATLQQTPKLKHGLSMIIRAKNEEATIEKCLTTLLPHVDEVIFVDNGSTDQTRLIAERLQQKYFNLKVYSYPIQIPRIGLEHCHAVLNHSTNTLGHYYNWCLSHSTLTNFAKWDADYICIEENFVEMVTQFDLRTRGDNFALWFSGLELYTDGERYWVDSQSSHNEYRIFSRKHGAHWVNLPPWEEIEQSYLYRAHKLVYEKPIYIELFRLEEIEFKDRGIFENNKRDKERMEYIQRFKETGKVPKSFIEVSGIDDPVLRDIGLSDFEIQDMRRSNKAFNSTPTVIHKSSRELLMDKGKKQVATVFTAIMSCRQNRDKQDIQRQTWIQDMERAGFSYAFAEGEIGRPDCLVDDRLLLNCRDEYEFLASKTLAIVTWVYYNTSFDYLLKIDDDVILNPFKLAQFDYSKYDYMGGRLIHDVFDPLWHINKTWNEQLSQIYCQIDEITPYYGGQFSYFLSRHAMKTLIDNSQELTTQLYEDFGVARALRAGEIKPIPNNTDWKSRNYEEWNREPRLDIACVSDIPVEKMVEVYKMWSHSPQWSHNAQEMNRNYDIKFDWMDIPHVISLLQSQ